MGKQSARLATFGPLARTLEQAGRELDDFAAACDFVRRFRDGNSTLAEFARGPLPPGRRAKVFQARASREDMGRHGNAV